VVSVGGSREGGGISLTDTAKHQNLLERGGRIGTSVIVGIERPISLRREVFDKEWRLPNQEINFTCRGRRGAIWHPYQNPDIGWLLQRETIRQGNGCGESGALQRERGGEGDQRIDCFQVKKTRGEAHQHRCQRGRRRAKRPLLKAKKHTGLARFRQRTLYRPLARIVTLRKREGLDCYGLGIQKKVAPNREPGEAAWSETRS